MKNPYGGGGEAEEIRVGRVGAWFVTVLFLLVLVVPPAVRNARDLVAGERTVVGRLLSREAGTDLVAHLRSVESQAEEAFFTEPPRRGLQRLASGWLSEGNRKTVIGEDGWMYLRPSVEALTATGPLAPAPVGAASDPALKRWRGPLEAVRVFADALRERGVELVLVPVPVKAMVRPEGLGLAPGAGVIEHEDAAAFYMEIREMGVTVVDLGERFTALRAGDPVFLKQDTHWTPRAMEVAAEEVERVLRGAGFVQERGATAYEVEDVEATSEGDLVRQLELGEGSGLFGEERVSLRRVIDPATGAAVGSDRGARVSVVGDSFVNVFDDPSLGFEVGEGERGGAGFAQHLALLLGEPVHVAALNGQGATGARQAFAKLYDDEVREKKALVWVIASRDLMYTPRLAVGTAVAWGDVVWNPEPRPEGAVPDEPEEGADGILVEGLLSKKAVLTDPKTVNYRESLFETEWSGLKTVGDGEDVEGYRVFFWSFRDKIRTPASRIEVGRQYRFRIFPEDAKPGVAGAQRDALEFDLSESYYGERPQPVPEN